MKKVNELQATINEMKEVLDSYTSDSITFNRMAIEFNKALEQQTGGNFFPTNAQTYIDGREDENWI